MRQVALTRLIHKRAQKSTRRGVCTCMTSSWTRCDGSFVGTQYQGVEEDSGKSIPRSQELLSRYERGHHAIRIHVFLARGGGLENTSLAGCMIEWGKNDWGSTRLTPRWSHVPTVSKERNCANRKAISPKYIRYATNSLIYSCNHMFVPVSQENFARQLPPRYASRYQLRANRY